MKQQHIILQQHVHTGQKIKNATITTRAHLNDSYAAKCNPMNGFSYHLYSVPLTRYEKKAEPAD